MPITVPRYDGPKVQPQGLPDVRIQPGQNVEEAFGGGASSAAVSSAGRELGNQVARISAYEQQQADEVAVQDADLQAGLLQNKLHVDVQKMQGKDSMGAQDYISKHWTEGTEKIKAGMANDYQRQLLDKRLKIRYLNLDQTAQVHQGNEMARYDQQTSDAYLKNAQNDAVLNFDNPERIRLSLYQQEQSIYQYARRNGWSDDQIKAAYADARNRTHVGVINKMLAENQVGEAHDYFQANKKFIEPDDQTRLSAFIERENLLLSASDKADEILAGAKDEADAVKGLDKITDKALRAATKAELETKLKERTLIYNANEASAGTKIATGQYKGPYDLEADRGGMTDEFYRVASESFSVKLDSTGSKSEKQKKYAGLVEKFGGLSDVDAYSKARKYADFRKDVLASKAYLNAEQFQKLMTWTDPTFVQKNIEPKQSMLDAGIKFLSNYYRNFTLEGRLVQALNTFMTKATDPSVKPAEVSAVARELVRDEAYRRNPDMMNLAEPSNYVYNEGNVSVAYPAKSDAKNDTTETEDMVTVIRRSDGQRGSIPRKNFDNERYKLA